MTREIKFRAWNKKAEVYETGWCYPKRIHEITDKNGFMEFGFYPNDDVILMQYTGLKDKNGKEIYEGDIVRILYTDWASQSVNDKGEYPLSVDDYMKSISKNGVVVFSGDRYVLRFKSEKYGEYNDRMYEGTHGRKEVIGNIYENPELLK